MRRGAQVKEGVLLFSLESTSETAARDEARRKLAQAKANLEDVKKGKRPTEMESTDAQLNQARAALLLSEKEYGRQEHPFATGWTSEEDLTGRVRCENRTAIACRRRRPT